MTAMSQLVNFIQQKHITRLLYYYYYYLFQIPKYFIVYCDSFDINFCQKCLFADDNTESKYIFS